ncbi:YhcN/YlaJ family sporulation lipoprotein [Fictibacillus aquaticus]|uniref:Sporulation protein n=1 Tax=Fictibacillus aquaticus TaxID=2021314 RepID=A0A235F9R1_9BACL|nr:YhcN/YlaJ family sporulation lipoprotein [Fictibacillus aquaticus]OYD57992.1 hypothetical protein CGZ90_08870 [Fictibacillus aquaticus]
MRQTIAIMCLIIACGCGRTAADAKNGPEPSFLPREYYRVHQPYERPKTAQSIAEDIRKEVAGMPSVRQAAVLKKNGEYVIAVKLDSYSRKSHAAICLNIKRTVESKWAEKAVVFSSPREFRTIRNETKRKG